VGVGELVKAAEHLVFDCKHLPLDPDVTITWFRKSAKQGNQSALFRLATRRHLKVCSSDNDLPDIMRTVVHSPSSKSEDDRQARPLVLLARQSAQIVVAGVTGATGTGGVDLIL
jgi:TPR repeat protein